MTENLPTIELDDRLSLRPAQEADLDAVWDIIKKDSDWLSQTKDLHHWAGYYTREKISEKLKKQEVYLVGDGSQNVGTITLDTNPVEYYREKEEINQFSEPEAPALYVTSLAVLPEMQGKGIASKLMNFADNEARKRGIKYIRFDCRARYSDLVNFYQKRGYKIVGQTLDEEDNNEVYYLMEKNLEEKLNQFGGTIRDLKKEDINQLRPILATWIKSRDTGQPLPDEVEKDLEFMEKSSTTGNDRKYFVAEDEKGEVVGVIGYKKPDDRMIPFTKTSKPAELVNAYVKIEERKGRGVGRALVAKLEESAKANGFTEIVLNSGPRYEKTGWGFYDKLPGYKRVGIATEYYGKDGDAPVWRKEL